MEVGKLKKKIIGERIFIKTDRLQNKKDQRWDESMRLIVLQQNAHLLTIILASILL